MSRRVMLFALATSAVLIVTQASADPKCVGDKCAAAQTEGQLRSPRPPARGEKATLRRTSPEERALAETSGLGDETGWRSHHGHFRHISPHQYGYVVGVPVGPGPVVLAGPPFNYGGYYGYGGGYYIGRPVYLFAPSAKIISLDRGD